MRQVGRTRRRLYHLNQRCSMSVQLRSLKIVKPFVNQQPDSIACGPRGIPRIAANTEYCVDRIHVLSWPHTSH